MAPTAARTRRGHGKKGPSVAQILEMQGEAKKRRAADDEATDGDDGRRTAAASPADGLQPREANLSFKDVFFFCCFAYLFYRWFMGDSHVFNCDPDQPMVTFTDGFLEQQVFDGVKVGLQEHPWLGPEPPDTYNFSHTNGFSITLKEEGLAEFRSMPELEAAWAFFQAARAPGTNAWVLNVVAYTSESYGRGDFAIEAHIDDTPGFIPMLRTLLTLFNRKFASCSTSVLYVSIPEDMEGGELELFDWNSGKAFREANKPDGVPSESVKPEENKLVVFRGDTVHRVRGYHSYSQPKQRRISLALEQYKLQDLMLNLTAPFDIRARR